MARPCILSHPIPKARKGLEGKDDCHICWLALNNAAFQQQWGEIGTVCQRGPCIHLGEDSREVLCKTCQGHTEIKVKKCTVFGECTIAKPIENLPICATCSRHEEQKLMTDNPRTIILRNHLSPGDVLAMTAAIYSLHKQHPGRYLTAVDTTAPALFEHNPDIITLETAKARGAEEVQTHYPAINESNQRAIHFLQAYCEYFSDALQVKVPLLTNKPMLYLSPEEKAWLPQVHEITGRPTKYFLVCAGYKNDFVAKFWGHAAYQSLVDILRGKIVFVQIGDASHNHQPLKNVISLVGKTDQRQLVRLVYHSQGAVGGHTFLMHLAAALEKVYFCIAGGREPVAWNSYERQQTFHTIGLLECCRSACWKSRVVKLNDNSDADNSLCDNPQPGDPPIPRCLSLIRPEMVAERILMMQG
jgi:ADP-heptose:LPS heptosyltransferase